MTPDDFRAALTRLGWTEAEAARRLETDERTIRRWKAGPDAKGGRPVPGPVRVALRLFEGR